MSEDDEKKIQALVEKRRILSEELLSLQKSRDNHKRKIEAANKRMTVLSEQIKSASFEIGRLKGEYGRSGDMSMRVSDHAIVRYLERYRGIDMLEVISEILEHPDRRYSGDVVTTVYADDPGTPEINNHIKMIKFRNKKKGPVNE